MVWVGRQKENLSFVWDWIWDLLRRKSNLKETLKGKEGLLTKRQVQKVPTYSGFIRVFQVYNGAKAIHIQEKLYFEF